ncbi:unnamed protein product, partial [Didymodactylos carnosus]
CGHVELFNILLQYNAPFHTPDIFHAYPIHYASQICGEDTLLEDDISRDTVKRLQILNKLIACHVPVDCIDNERRTPFIWAASAGAVQANRLLWKSGADPFRVEKDGLTALHCSSTRGYLNCIKFLIEECKCNIEAEDVNGCTPIFYAVTMGHGHACKVLLDLKANPNHQDNRGRTPIHCAATKGNIECLTLLERYHGNIWIKTKRGDCPLHEAVNARETKLVSHILQCNPSKVDFRNGENRSCLHIAASNGDNNMCDTLIKHGARINILLRTSTGNYLTPFDIARIRQQDLCAKFLLDASGQRGNILANMYARSIQRYYRNYKHSQKLKTTLLSSESLIDSPKDVQIQYHQLMNTAARRCQLPGTKNTIILTDSSTKPSMTLTSDSGTESSFVHRQLSQNSSNFVPITKDSSSVLESEEVKPLLEQQEHLIKVEYLPKLHRQLGHIEKRKRNVNRENTIGRLSNDGKKIESKKILNNNLNEISTSVKLYERHKLIAQELYKIKCARINKQYIIINHAIYNILMENAFNPMNKKAIDIEKYLEKLCNRYEKEAETMNKRSKSVPSKRTLHTSYSEKRTSSPRHCHYEPNNNKPKVSSKKSLSFSRCTYQQIELMRAYLPQVSTDVYEKYFVQKYNHLEQKN